MQDNNVTLLLSERIDDEKEKFVFHNEPEEKAAEVLPLLTPGNGGFNTENHQFFLQICQLFQQQLFGDKIKMNDVCCLLVEFMNKIKQRFNRISQDDLSADIVPDCQF